MCRKCVMDSLIWNAVERHMVTLQGTKCVNPILETSFNREPGRECFQNENGKITFEGKTMSLDIRNSERDKEKNTSRNSTKMIKNADYVVQKEGIRIVHTLKIANDHKNDFLNGTKGP